MILETLLGTGILGALTGFLGSAFTAIMSYQQQKLKNTHEVAMAKIEQDTIRLEAEAQVKIQTAKTEGEVEVVEAEAFKIAQANIEKPLFEASYMQFLMSSRWTSWVGALIASSFGFVDVLRNLVRPLTTYYLLFVATWLVYVCWQTARAAQLLSGNPIDPTLAYELLKLSVQTILYLTVTVVTFWFSDRRLAKWMMRLNDGNLKTSGK